MSKHLKHIHHISTEYYFSTYIQIRPDCVICKTPVVFKSYNIGFSECCGSKSCNTINNRKKLKLDINKYNFFVSKVSNNMTELWKTDQSKRIENMSKSISIVISNMSKEEKIEKYGYLNKLSNYDREIFIEKMLQTGCHKWWKTATKEEKDLIIAKRSDTLRKTWDTRGSEILNKIQETFLKNNKTIPLILTEEEYIKMDLLLSNFFNL